MQKSYYAIQLLSHIDGVKTPVFDSSYFKEFPVRFEGYNLTVREINKKLMKFGIHGGKDLSEEFPDLGETALYCVTEVHSMEDIKRLGAALEEILGRGR